MQLQIIPYLGFHGLCEEALHTYLEVFGGELLYLSRWDESNCSHPGLVGQVMHAEFRLGATRMSGGDVPEAKCGTDIRLMVHMESEEQARHAIARLAEGGRLLSPLKPHPAPDDGGCGSLVEDGFGCRWIITCPNNSLKR